VDWLGTVYRIHATTDAAALGLVAAVLPGTRSVRVGAAATVFATMIWTGPGTATDCEITPLTPVPGDFMYQTTAPGNNHPTGSPNTPVSIASGASQTFLIAFTPTAPFDARELLLGFRCANAPAAAVIPGLDTLLLSATIQPVADIVALAATAGNDGIVNVPGTGGAGAFAVATTNLGAETLITVSVDTGAAELPVTASICRTGGPLGMCVGTLAPSVTLEIGRAATPTFTVVVTATGPVAFDPTYHRVHVRFKDGAGVTRGLTSVAIRTQ
jgi:hypothetical protein